MKRWVKHALCTALAFLPAPLTFAGISLTAIDVPNVESFDSLASTGTSTTVPAGWAFSESGTGGNTTYTAGTGSANTGDTYSFGVAGTNVVTERAFGGLQSGTVIPTLGASYTNNTADIITNVLISYVGEQWRLGATGRNDKLDFQISTNATSLTTGTWVDVDSLDFTAPLSTGTVGALDGNAAANRVSLSAVNITLPSSVAVGADFWIRWNSVDVTGADDGLAIDNVSVQATPAPEPTSLGLLVAAAAVLGRRRRHA